MKSSSRFASATPNQPPKRHLRFVFNETPLWQPHYMIHHTTAQTEFDVSLSTSLYRRHFCSFFPMDLTQMSRGAVPHSPSTGATEDHSALSGSLTGTPQSPVEVAVSQPLVAHSHPKSVSSGLSDLPVELMLEIFYFGLAIAWRETKGDVYLTRISSVCRSWRAFAFSLPHLWTSMHWKINKVGPLPLYDEVLVQQATAYLDRSKGLDIDVTFSFSPGSADLTSLKSVFFQHLHRCRSLKISATEASSLTALLPITGSMPRLETLFISCQNPFGSESRLHEVPLFQGTQCARNVRSLYLRGEGVHSLTRINVVSQHLEHINLNLQGCKREWLEATMGGILGPYSSVKFLSVCEDVTFFHQIRGYHPPIILPRITTLQIGSALDLPFRDTVRTPNLRVLELVEQHIGLKYNGITRSALEFELHTLSLKTPLTGQAPVAKLYGEQPSIKVLVVDIECCKVDTLKALLPGTKLERRDAKDWIVLPTLLPALQVIRLRGSTGAKRTSCFLDLLAQLLFVRSQLQAVWEGAGAGTLASNGRIQGFLDKYPDRFRREACTQ